MRWRKTVRERDRYRERERDKEVDDGKYKINSIKIIWLQSNIISIELYIDSTTIISDLQITRF